MSKIITELVAKLKAINAEYEASVKARKDLPMMERMAKWNRLQQRADLLCRDIMRTERAIINELLQ